MSTVYEQDFYAWLHQQSHLLRQGRLQDLDIQHLAEELEALSRKERLEFIHRLGVLMAHLLKWQYQPQRRSASWEATIREQRRRVRRRLRLSPSLKAFREDDLDDAYGDARLRAIRETGLDPVTFPAPCPYTWDQVVDDDFWPA